MHPTLELEATAFTLDQLRDREAPQIALAGRSNVGKSSLINALANRKQLAKTSSTPGKTRSVNYYRASPQNFLLVDLPGYGYAQCSKAEREKWAVLINKYLELTPGLKGLILLLDCRLPPQKADMALAAFAQQQRLTILPVLTKADKCTRKDQSTRQKEWEALLGRRPLLTSASKREGVDAVWKELLAFFTEESVQEPSA